MTIYGPRCPVHPDRIGPVKTKGPNRLLVIHTSEGSEGPNSAENLCGYISSPGDKVGTNGMYGSSYHYLTDTDRVLPAVPSTLVAYAAAGANHDGIHICIPGKAGQTRAAWLDTVSRDYIRRCAEVMVDESEASGIPLVRLGVADIQAAKWGYCGHYDISRAYHLSDHTDPGPFFPWDVLADDIKEFTMQYTPDQRRLLDTRELGGKVKVGQLVEYNIGRLGVSAVVNFTITEPNGGGFLTAWGSGGQPDTSNVNWDRAGQVVSNVAVVPLDNGVIRFTVGVNPTHVVVDLQGVFS